MAPAAAWEKSAASMKTDESTRSVKAGLVGGVPAPPTLDPCPTHVKSSFASKVVPDVLGQFLEASVSRCAREQKLHGSPLVAAPENA